MSSETPTNDLIFETLERMLQRARPRSNAKEQMEILRSHFITPDSMLRASPQLLEKLGLHPHVALLMGQFTGLCRLMDVTSYPPNPKLASLEEATPYVMSHFIGLQVERFYMFCLNQRGFMKARILLNEGTDDSALFSLRIMLSKIIDYMPSGVFLVHNHPMGTMRPSQEDIDCTVDVLRALEALHVPLLDHLIITQKQAVSMRDNGFIPEAYWIRQTPCNSLLRNWLKPAVNPQRPMQHQPSNKRSLTKLTSKYRVLGDMAFIDPDYAAEKAKKLYVKLSVEELMILREYNLRKKAYGVAMSKQRAAEKRAAARAAKKAAQAQSQEENLLKD